MNLNQHIGLLTIRLILGFIFLMQGVGKVFKFGVENVYQNFFLSSYENLFPNFLLKLTAYYTSYVELVGGALLILGLFRNYSLYALASVLVIVTFGHGLIDPIWDLSHVMYRAILLIALLLLPEHWDYYSVDRLIGEKRSGIGFKRF